VHVCATSRTNLCFYLFFDSYLTLFFECEYKPQLYIVANANAAWRAQANMNANQNDYANTLGKNLTIKKYFCSL